MGGVGGGGESYKFWGNQTIFIGKCTERKDQKGFRGGTTQICWDTSFIRMSVILATGNPGSVIIPISFTQNLF